MTPQNWDKKLEHTVECQYANVILTSRNFYKCTVCNINNRRQSAYAIIWEERKGSNLLNPLLDNIAYVPYREEEVNGKKIRKYCHFDPDTAGIEFWPIYCSYTKDEVMIKDIIE